MKTIGKLIGAVALLASLPGTTLSAQDMAGQAGMKDALPFRPRMQHLTQNGDLTSVGSLLQQSSGGGQATRVGPSTGFERLPVDVPEHNLANDIVPGAPFAVFTGTSPHNPVALLDAGIVPTDGRRVLGMTHSTGSHETNAQRQSRSGGQSRMSVYFRSGGVIICLAGESESQLPSSSEVVLVGPGASAALGKGATLKAEIRVSGLRGAARTSDDRGSSAAGEQGEGRHVDRSRRSSATGARASVGNNGTLPLK